MKYTILKWCEIFGIELIDNDGFRKYDPYATNAALLPLDSFLHGIAACTIKPINKDKYAVLNALI